MIQFNLLPDVKIEFVKAQRTKRLVMGSAMIATATTFVIFLLLFLTVQGIQKKSISDLNADIKKNSDELKNTPDLNKILTIQSQLASLSDLHDQKIVASRMFNMMQQVTPIDVTISEHDVDFTANTMTITGETLTLDRVNTFIDTLKFAKFSSGGEQKSAFTNVVLSQFGRNETGTTYTITLSFDQDLFKVDQNPTLVVPKTITTRSVIEQPTDIFKKTTGPTSSTGTTGQGN